MGCLEDMEAVLIDLQKMMDGYPELNKFRFNIKGKLIGDINNELTIINPVNYEMTIEGDAFGNTSFSFRLDEIGITIYRTIEENEELRDYTLILDDVVSFLLKLIKINREIVDIQEDMIEDASDVQILKIAKLVDRYLD